MRRKALGLLIGLIVLAAGCRGPVIYRRVAIGEAPPADPRQAEFDALSVDLSLRIEPDDGALSGTATWTLRAVQPLDTVVLDLSNAGLSVSNVTRADGRSLAFDHRHDRLEIRLDQPARPGDTVRFAVQYSGTPKPSGFGSYLVDRHGPTDDPERSPVVATLSEPSFARSWWPCKDVPDDKLTATVRLSVPNGLTGISNGRLISRRADGDDRTQFSWRTDYPTAPYLIAFAVSDYVSFTGSVRLTDSTLVPLGFHVYPEDAALARRQFARTGEQVRFFSDRFGVDYPFAREGYRLATFPWTGGMEHQTVSFLVRPGEMDDDAYSSLQAHELAHQWFGDSVTLGDWNETWLHEGFATYAEALWAEGVASKRSGPAAGRATLSRAMEDLIEPFDPDPLADPVGFPFDRTVYRKGAWVVHMLRREIGDRAFFGALKLYLTEHAYGNATTLDLQQAAERASGRNLGWFFDQWVRRPGPVPTLADTTVSRDTTGGAIVAFTLRQTGPLYRLTVPVRFTLPDGSTRGYALPTDRRARTFLAVMPAAPIRTEIDPEAWLLFNPAMRSTKPPSGAPAR